MTYRVVFDVNCAYLDLVEADSKEEAENIIRQRFVDCEVDSGDLDIFDFYFNYAEEEQL